MTDSQECSPPGIPSPPTGGEWRGPWSDEVQADWLVSLSEIALSKPYVETICLQPLIDDSEQVIASGGLLRADRTPKPAFERLVELRQRLRAKPEK